MTCADPIDAVAARKVEALIARGREALVKLLEPTPEEQRPIGASNVNVVTEADFLFHTKACLDHASKNRTTIIILCDGGVLCAELSAFTMRKAP